MSDPADKIESVEPAGGIGDGLLNRGRLNERSDARLIRRAILNGWPVKDEIKQLVVNQMSLIVGKSDDERNKIAASKVLVAADSINARREATEAGDGEVHVNVDVGVQVAIVQDEAWYGDTKAHDQAAQAIAPPAPDAPVPQPIQSPGLRTPLGENGDRPANGHPRTR